METLAETRYFYFFFGSLFAYIGCVGSFLIYPKTKYVTFGFLVFCLSLANADFHFFSDPAYRGIRGLQVHLIDILGLALITIGVLGGDLRKPRWFLPLTIPFLLYIVVALLSWAMIPLEPMQNAYFDPEDLSSPRFFYLKRYPLFVLAKMIRGYVTFWLAANLCRQRDYLRSFDYSMLVTALWLTGYAIFDRYALGSYRISGPLGHPNAFNSFVAMVGVYLWQRPFFLKSGARATLFLLGAYGCFLAVVLTVSRSSLAGLVLAMAIGTPCLLLVSPLKRSLSILSLMCFAAMFTFLKAFDTLMERFVSVTRSTGILGREEFWGEALSMAFTHPLGVGLGNFTAYISFQYGLYGGRGLFTHNTWAGVIGELGFAGLVVYVFYWLRTWHLVVTSAVRSLRRRELMIYFTVIGCGMALIVLLVQMWYHGGYIAPLSDFLATMVTGVLVSQYLILRDPFFVSE